MRFRRRKGISYILEVAMMTLVVVALATVVLTWGLGQVSNSRIALTGAVNDRISRMQEGINIEDVQMLTQTSMRVYVRNTGAIQVLIDAVYVSHANTPVLGTCPAGSFQSGTVSVAAGQSTSAIVTLSTPEPSTGFTVSAAPSSASFTATQLSGSSGYTITDSAHFTVSFSGNAPAGGGTAIWYTNYASCASASSSTKLNLAINAVGALDVTVGPSPVVNGGTGASGTSQSGTTSTTLQTTSGGFGSSNYANDVVWITSGTGQYQCQTILSNSNTVLTLAGTWNVTPVAGNSGYSISSTSTTGPSVCSANTYTVTVSTNRGTSSTASFTV